MRRSHAIVVVLFFLLWNYSLVNGYEIDVHYHLTKYLALWAGFSESDAEQVATADQELDTKPEFNPLPNPNFCPQLRSLAGPASAVAAIPAACKDDPEFQRMLTAQRAYHFVDAKRLHELRDSAFRTKNLKILGHYLHALQDTFAHSLMDYTDLPPLDRLVASLGQLPDEQVIGHLRYGHSVDKTYERPDLAELMAQYLYMELTRFQGSEDRWTELDAAIARFAREKDLQRKLRYLSGLPPASAGGQVGDLPDLPAITASSGESIDAYMLLSKTGARWIYLVKEGTKTSIMTTTNEGEALFEGAKAILIRAETEGFGAAKKTVINQYRIWSNQRASILASEALVNDRTTTITKYDPPKPLSDFRIGKSNLPYRGTVSSRFFYGHGTETTTQVDDSPTIVVSEEEVVVPAGRFLARKVEWLTRGERSVTWFAKGIGLVKSDSAFSSPNRDRTVKSDLLEYSIPGRETERRPLPAAHLEGTWVGEACCDEWLGRSARITLRLGQKGSQVNGTFHLDDEYYGVSGDVKDDQLYLEGSLPTGKIIIQGKISYAGVLVKGKLLGPGGSSSFRVIKTD